MEVGDSVLVGDILIANARRFPSADAVVSDDSTSSWSDLLSRAARVANWLSDDVGISAGERVATLAENRTEHIETGYATALGGFVHVPINTRLSVPELEGAIADSGARVLFYGASEQPHAELLRDSTGIELAAFDAGAPGAQYSDIVSSGSVTPPRPMIDDDSLRGLVYSSGTSGAAKAIAMTHRGVMASTINAQIVLGLRPFQRHLVVMPLGLAAGQVLPPWYGYLGGATIVCRFEPANVLDAIERHRVNTMLVAPTMLGSMMEEQRRAARDLSSLELIVYGAAPTPIDLLVEAISFFDCELIQGYGSSESGALISTLPPADHRGDPNDAELRRRLRSVGREAPFCRIRIVDDENNEVPDGEIGELAVHSALSMRDYWGRPELTNEVLHDGWLRLGDIGVREPDGYLFVVDRKSEMIISGGFNVSPHQVETTLEEHPNVRMAAVVGRPDPHWGEVVHAVVTLVHPEATTEAQLIDFCKQRIASYKKPRTIEFMDELPLNASGKIDRKAIKAIAASRDVGPPT